MTCENNKKGCNNKILISTLMLASMVCILSVSDMLGGVSLKLKESKIWPLIKKLENDDKNYELFKQVLEKGQCKIKYNVCCCGYCGDGHIDYEKSTVAKSWLADERSLSTFITEFFTYDDGKIQCINKSHPVCLTNKNLTQFLLDTLPQYIEK